MFQPSTKVMDSIEARYEHNNTITGLPTGFPDLDELLNGLQPSTLNVIGARPSMGKTALALCIANNVAQTKGSIGYVEYAYAKQNKLIHTNMVNKAGKPVAPSSASFQAAAANADWSSQPGYGVILANARAMGEFGAVYVVSGHISGATDTMPLRVEKLFQEYRTPASMARATPELGEHTDEVLMSVGYTKEQLKALRDKGVI